MFRDLHKENLSLAVAVLAGMTPIRILFALSILTTGVLAQTAPVADHHQHLFSPSIAEAGKITPITAKDVVALLDEAGIKRGVLLSVAYQYGRPGREPQNEYEKVKEENDWVAAQAALYPNRLVAFCGFNPLKDYALAELTRCAKNKGTRHGIKMHFGNSDVRLENPEHIEKLKIIFRAANANRMAIVVHMRASISLDRPYGAEQARAFLDHLLPLAKDITVQIAHTAGSGPGYNDPKAHTFLESLLDAIAAGTPGMKKGDNDVVERSRRSKNLWFDITSSAYSSNSAELSALLVKHIRQIGVKRILYGTDAALQGNLPRVAWAEVGKLPLSKKEIETIAKNRAPYLR